MTQPLKPGPVDRYPGAMASTSPGSALTAHYAFIDNGALGSLIKYGLPWHPTQQPVRLTVYHYCHQDASPTSYLSCKGRSRIYLGGAGSSQREPADVTVHSQDFERGGGVFDKNWTFSGIFRTDKQQKVSSFLLIAWKRVSFKHLFYEIIVFFIMTD